MHIILCFPVLSALLTRAAVVYSQRYRTDQNHHLTVRQLFALADQGWYNLLLVLQKPAISGLLVFGWLLLAVALVLPIVRSALVTQNAVTLSLDYQQYHVNSTIVGASQAPGLLVTIQGSSILDNTRAKLQSTTGGYESQLWPLCQTAIPSLYWDVHCGFTYLPYNNTQSVLNSYWEAATEPNSYDNGGVAPMFAASLQAGSTTGSAPNGYALGLQSGAKCEASYPDEFSSNCTRAAAETNGWNTSIFIEQQIRIDICVPSSNNGSFWGVVNGSSPWKPYDFVEDIYIGIQEQMQSDGYIYEMWAKSGTQADYDEGDEIGTGTTLWAHCQLDTSLSYFLLGNDSSNGVPSPFLDNLPSDFLVPSYVAEGADTSSPALGPLMTTAQALFGNNSWFDMLSTFVSDNSSTNGVDGTTELVILTLLCQSMPLNRASYFTASTSVPNWCDGFLTKGAGTTIPADLLRAFFAIFDIPRLGRAALNTGAFFANDYLLSAALPYDGDNYEASIDYNYLYHFDSYTTAPRVPVLANTAALVVVTVLIAIQGLAILALLAVIYSVPVWTHTLDALALAGLGAQLAERVVFHAADSWGADTLRPSVLDADSRKELFGLNGLIDMTDG